jgi:hypothetical protein
MVVLVEDAVGAATGIGVGSAWNGRAFAAVVGVGE